MGAHSYSVEVMHVAKVVAIFIVLLPWLAQEIPNRTAALEQQVQRHLQDQNRSTRSAAPR